MQNVAASRIGPGRSVLLLWTLLLNTSSAHAGDPALPGNHPLTQSQVGELLITELRCAACHGGIQPGTLSAKTAPDLLNVGARISPDYLKRFLASPSITQPGTMMPDMLASKSEGVIPVRLGIMGLY